MDLAALLGKVPPLLEACIGDDIPALRILRLVSKGASLVALQGLTSYTLKLLGDEATDTNVGGARMLRQTQLKKLIVHLKLSGSFTPAVLLEDFMNQAGSCLSTVTNLDLSINDTGSSAATVAVLIKSLECLLSVFPTLKSLTSQGTFYPAVLRKLGEVCPLLSALRLQPVDGDLANSDEVLNLIPSLLPQLRSLALPNPDNSTADGFPDLRGQKAILTLDLKSFGFTNKAQWLCLPPNLQHLKCHDIATGPVAVAEGRTVIASLLTIMLDPAVLDLAMVAQLLRAAPALQVIGDEDVDASTTDETVMIMLYLEADTATDLYLVRERMQTMQKLQQAAFWVDLGGGAKASLELAIIAALPCMTHTYKCIIEGVGSSNLAELLKVFPNLGWLSLIGLGGLDDAELQGLAACADLTTLKLFSCSHVSPMGLVAICLRLPTLSHVGCCQCPNLTAPKLEMCAMVLQMLGRIVHMKETTV